MKSVRAPLGSNADVAYLKAKHGRSGPRKRLFVGGGEGQPLQKVARTILSEVLDVPSKLILLL